MGEGWVGVMSPTLTVVSKLTPPLLLPIKGRGSYGDAMTNGDPYRRGVGVMLLNSQGKVSVIDNPEDAWQMPHRGIDAASHRTS